MKVGITTHYLHSNNYGGLLQAFALVHTLQLFDECNPEQIKVKIEQTPTKSNSIRAKKEGS